jgi:hypothetical protein
VTDHESSTDGNPSTAGGDTESTRKCTFNPIANRYEWWVPGVGFTGQPCTPSPADGSASGNE